MKKKLLTCGLACVLTVMSALPAFAGTWTQDGPSWSYTKDDGNKAVSEWITDSEKWYYFDDNGIMETGWLLDNEKWYFLGSDGGMFANQYTPKGNYCGADGAWIENYTPDYGSSSDDSSSSSSSGSGSNSGQGSGSSGSGSSGSGSSGSGSSGALQPGRSDGPG